MALVEREAAELARGGGGIWNLRVGDLLPRLQRRSTGSIWESRRAASDGRTSRAAVFDVHVIVCKVDRAVAYSRPRAGISRVAICERHREGERKCFARDRKRRAERCECSGVCARVAGF